VLTSRCCWCREWLRVEAEGCWRAPWTWLNRRSWTPWWWTRPSPASSSTVSASWSARRSRPWCGISGSTSVLWRPCTTSLQPHVTQPLAKNNISFRKRPWSWSPAAQFCNNTPLNTVLHSVNQMKSIHYCYRRSFMNGWMDGWMDEFFWKNGCFFSFSNGILQILRLKF